MSEIEARLKKMGIELTPPPKPVASYVGFIRQDNMVFVSGQLPFKDGELLATGLLGRDVDIETAAKAAAQCAVNILAQIKVACEGDMERIIGCVRLGGFVASMPDFYDHPKVVNGASDLIGDALGEEKGAHSRAAVGVASLPLNTCVEVDAIFAIE